MGVTGGIVALRPQLATILSPAAFGGAPCVAVPDWTRAEREISEFAHARINRIYGPYGTDTRYHFRLATDRPNVYRHVIYDACAGKVLGAVNLGWMDWTVALHRDLTLGSPGRLWVGAMGVLMLVSGVSGLLLWLLAKPDLRTAFRISMRFSKATPRQTHRAIGLVAACLLGIESFSGLWLCFPQFMRSTLEFVAPISDEVRPPRAPQNESTGGRAPLSAFMTAAHDSFPDGQVREIRFPEGNAPVQVRVWRPGDFRSLGNNLVFLAAGTARVLAVDRYSEKSASNRFLQAMPGLHFDEWGGPPYVILSSAAGLATPVLFLTGLLIWWYSRKRSTGSATGKRRQDETMSENGHPIEILANQVKID